MVELTPEERQMLQDILDRVQVPGNVAHVYVALRKKLLGPEAKE